MEDELFDNDNFEPTETPQEAPFDDTYMTMIGVLILNQNTPKMRMIHG